MQQHCAQPLLREPDASDPPLALSVEGITKQFGAFMALDGVDLSLPRRSILALLGENGAGKTSLMNVLYGIYRPDAGRITIAGEEVVLKSPRDAIRHRVGMIHQHFHQANALSAIDNIALGHDPLFTRLDVARHRRAIAALAARFDFDVSLDEPVSKLPMGMRQRIEILKALYHGAEILILDEPTSILAPSEIASFLNGIKKLRDEGAAILFVTHKLEEVMEVADQIAVMRRGKMVAERQVAATDPRELSRLMIGHELRAQSRRKPAESANIALSLRDVSARGERKGVALQAVSLTLKKGEVLGIAGVDGNGQSELAEVIVGLRALDAGRIEIEGADISRQTARERAAHIGFIPEDRHQTGLVLNHSVELNLILRSFNRAPASRRGLLDRRFIADNGTARAADYDIRLVSPKQAARDLSGGNQQKIILAREIEAAPEILVVMQPTKGLDLSAIEFVHAKLDEQRAAGVAILYISTELEHLLDMADRVAVIFNGRIVGEVDAHNAHSEQLGLLMAGMAPSLVEGAVHGA